MISSFVMINLPVILLFFLTFSDIWLVKDPLVGNDENEDNEEVKEFRRHDWELAAFKAAFLVLLYLTLAVDYNMMVSSLTDPGILPARIWPTWVHEKYMAKPIYDE